MLLAVNKGLCRAKHEFNQRLEEAQSRGERIGEPPYEYGIIVSALRMFFKGPSPCRHPQRKVAHACRHTSHSNHLTVLLVDKV